MEKEKKRKEKRDPNPSDPHPPDDPHARAEQGGVGILRGDFGVFWDLG